MGPQRKGGNTRISKCPEGREVSRRKLSYEKDHLSRLKSKRENPCPAAIFFPRCSKETHRIMDPGKGKVTNHSEDHTIHLQARTLLTATRLW